jgi:hypothetical protein
MKEDTRLVDPPACPGDHYCLFNDRPAVEAVDQRLSILVLPEADTDGLPGLDSKSAVDHGSGG